MEDVNAGAAIYCKVDSVDSVYRLSWQAAVLVVWAQSASASAEATGIHLDGLIFDKTTNVFNGLTE